MNKNTKIKIIIFVAFILGGVTGYMLSEYKTQMNNTKYTKILDSIFEQK